MVQIHQLFPWHTVYVTGNKLFLFIGNSELYQIVEVVSVDFYKPYSFFTHCLLSPVMIMAFVLVD